MPGLRWGRLQFDVGCPLRRGAWYRVLSVEEGGVLVYVNFREIRVPRYAMEVVSTPPKCWTVVPAPQGNPKLPPEFAPHYTVCPNCWERVPLPPWAGALRCPRCRGTYEIDWTEGYLSYSTDIVSPPPKRRTMGLGGRSAVKLPKEFAPRSTVCPHCREPARVPARARALRCPGCRRTYAVDRTESYLQAH